MIGMIFIIHSIVNCDLIIKVGGVRKHEFDDTLALHV